MKIPKYISFLILLLTFLLFQNNTYAQIRSLRNNNKDIQITQTDQDQPKSRKVKKAEAKAAADKEKQENAYTRAKEKDMKHRMDLQSPQTKKRMKDNKRQAEQNNDHYHQSFWQKMFGRKK